MYLRKRNFIFRSVHFFGIMALALLLSSTLAMGATTDVTWTKGSSGNWSGGTNWSSTPSYPNYYTTNVNILDGTSNVTLDTSVSVASLQLANGNTLTQNVNTSLSVYGPQINNYGQIVLNGGGGNTYLFVNGDTTLSGTGTLTLNTTTAGGSAYIYNNAGGTKTLTNQSIIQGEGIIGAGSGLAINNSNTINANSTGGSLLTTLTLSNVGGITNTGLLLATNSGVLQLNSQVINNASGNITANGANAVVQISNSTVQGGTLNAFSGGTLQNLGSSTLDGSTHGAVTLNGQYTVTSGSYTTILGTINNTNNIQVNGGGGYNTYLLVGGNTTLQDGGTVTMTTLTSSGNSHLYGAGAVTLTNVNNTIQGSGTLGEGTALTFINQVGGKVDANSTGGSLNTLL